ncbi:MAG: hypothetical protein ACYC66_10760 [Chloroflexota bacterium]
MPGWPSIWLPAALIAVAAYLLVPALPAEVPDTSSPPVNTSSGAVNMNCAVGQTFVARFDGLDRISVVLAAVRPTDEAEIAFHIKETPTGEPLRTVRRVISSLPIGDAGRFRPGAVEARWTTFTFDPIPDSAGRKLYFSVEGRGVPWDNTVRVLMFYHNLYALGQAHINETPVNAHVPFRAHSRGRVADYMSVLAENLAVKRTGALAPAPLYAAIGVAYLLLAFGLVMAAWRSKSSAREGQGAPK